MKKTRQPMGIHNKRGVILITVLAVVILLINIVTASYSWFAPSSLQGTGLKFEQIDNLRSESCTVTSVQYKDGNSEWVTAGLTCPVNNTASSDPTVGLQYFKLEISNSSTTSASNISILLNFTIPEKTTIGVTYPTNSVHTYNDYVDTNQEFLIRNAYVSASNTSEVGSGKLEVQFFVRNTGSSSINFPTDASNYKIVYN